MHCIVDCQNFVQLTMDLFFSHTQITLDIIDLELFITVLQLSSVKAPSFKANFKYLQTRYISRYPLEVFIAAQFV